MHVKRLTEALKQRSAVHQRCKLLLSENDFHPLGEVRVDGHYAAADVEHLLNDVKLRPHHLHLHNHMHHEALLTVASLNTSHRLDVPPVRLSTVGRRAFLASGATVWNDLPLHIASAPSLAVFRLLLTRPFCFPVPTKTITAL